jgi:adenylate kinase
VVAVAGAQVPVWRESVSADGLGDDLDVRIALTDSLERGSRTAAGPNRRGVAWLSVPRGHRQAKGEQVRLLLIGPPGSGKGTQAVRIGDHFGIAHISSGDLLRQHVTQGTPIGRTVQEFLARGDLVPDGIVMDVLRKPVENASREGGFVLDGFPRTVAQAEAAYSVARENGTWVQVALSLDVPREELMARILARGRDSGRSDDNLAVIRHRLDLFDATAPALIEYYARREVLITIHGAQPVDQVTADAIAALEGVQPSLR